MRVLIQRVRSASVEINGEIHSEIAQGLLVLLGITHDDEISDIQWLVKKLVNMRIFNDAEKVMNLSVNDLKVDVLVVSQFTLHANTKKGNRPSYIRAAKPATAVPLYEKFLEHLSDELNGKVQAGIFGADMQVALVNDGPVSIWLDSRERDY